MKTNRIQTLGALALCVLAASCAGLDKMKEGAKQITYKVDPNPLEAHQGKVAMSFVANVPAKMWDKKVSAEVTPILIFKKDSAAYPPVYVQGEAVQGNGQVISNVNGGQIKYPKQEIDFNGNMRIAGLIVRVKFTKGEDSLVTDTREMEMGPNHDGYIAPGVIATSALTSSHSGIMIPSKDAFTRTITESKVADIVYLINQAEVRSGELKKEDVKAINDYIAELNNDEKKAIKTISVSAYASPDGSTDLNTKLSGKRETSAQKLLEGTLKKNKIEKDIDAKSTPEDWEGFKGAVEKSDIQDKDLILRVLSLYTDPDVREKEIKNLSAVYKVLAKDILPSLRRSTLTVEGEMNGKTDDELKSAVPDSLTIEELLYGAKLCEGDLDKQLKYYEAAVKKYPQDYRGFNNKGVVTYKKGDLQGAEDILKQAEAIKAAPEVENNLGVVKLAMGDTNAAKEYFGKAAGAGPDLDENLGIVCVLEGDYEKAESYLANSTSTNAALVKILLEKYDAAISICNACTEDVGVKYYLKAIALRHKDDKDGALENIRLACEKESRWKTYAKSDMEFVNYFNDANFKKITD